MTELSASDTSEALLFFDCLFSDYLYSQDVEVESFRAACFKYGLQEEDKCVAILRNVCDQLKLSS